MNTHDADNSQASGKRRPAGFLGKQQIAITGALLASTVLGGVVSKAAGAQEAPRTDKEPGPVNLSLPPVKFDIKAGGLREALRAFEEATGIQLQIKIMTLRGLEAPAVEGTMEPEAALKQLLSKTDVVYRFTDANNVVLMRRVGRGHGHADTTATELATVSVAGAAGTAKVASPKYTEPMRDIPQTITVVSEEVMKQQGVVSLRDAVRNVAGITMEAGEGGRTPGDKFNVRGFSAAGDIYVDGVRDISGYSRESFNLEQIEVSKGPNSSIAGRGSTGGTINLVTKTPKAQQSRSLDLTLGSADLRRASVDVNQPLAVFGDPRAAFRVSAMTSEGGVAGLEVVKNKSWGVAPSLTLGLGTPTQMTLGYMRTGQNNIPSYGISTFNGVPDFDTRKFFGLRSLDFEKVTASSTYLRLNHQIGEHVRIQNQSSRGRSKSDRIVTPASPVASNPDSATRSPKTHINDNTVLGNQTNIVASFRTGAIGHNLVTGFEYTHEKSMWGRYIITGTNPPISDLNNPSANADYHPGLQAAVTREAEAHNVGAYAFETMHLHPKLELNGGVRWDSYSPKYVDSASKASAFKARKSSAVSGRGAVVVKPVEAGSIYASYGTSFNPSTEGLSSEAVSANSDLPPEKSRSYEIGSKWEFFKSRLLSSVALFRTEKINARTTDPLTNLQVLAGKQRVEGAEAGVTGNVSDKVSVIGTYSYMESKYVESLQAGQTGQAFTNVPKHAASVWATYRPADAITIGGGSRFSDKRLLRISGGTQVYVPSYTTFDAMASYRLRQGVNLQMNLYNLTDKLYFDAGRMWVPAAGRSVAVTTSVAF